MHLFSEDGSRKVMMSLKPKFTGELSLRTQHFFICNRDTHAICRMCHLSRTGMGIASRAAGQGPTLGLKFYCCHFEDLNAFCTKVPPFLFCPGPHKLLLILDRGKDKPSLTFFEDCVSPLLSGQRFKVPGSK